jgi:hypothetical protein
MATIFDEILFDPSLFRKESGSKYPVSATLEWANSQPRNAQTGVRKTAVGRLDAINLFTLDVALLNASDSLYLQSFLRGGQGSACGFRAYLPHDHTLTMEPIGTGNGTLTQFKITKTSVRPGDTTHPDVRRIFKPVVQVAKETNGFQLRQKDGATPRVVGGSPNFFDKQFKVFFDAVEQTANWTVDCKTGILTLTGAAIAGSSGHIIYVDGVFDTPIAFEGNSFTMLYDTPSGAQFSFRELLGAELGLT